MKTTFRWLYVFGLCTILPFKVWSKVCTGGYHCTAPHECCAQGCCLYVPSSGYNPTNHIDNYYVLNSPVKYYLWILVLMVVGSVVLVWCCRARWEWRGWLRSCGCYGAPPASEADSAGSCYYPPQYSRCGSLCRTAQPAPPPYNEVTSKPDLYPMVIYLGADKGDGDLMVQYFKNYIVRPPGSLSATSTADSLSSSYLCNTANEANTIIPPPYSCAGSVEWSCAPATSAQRQALLRSISSVTCHEYIHISSPRRSLHHSTSAQIRTSENGIPNSHTINNIQDCENSGPIAQTSSGNTHNCVSNSNQISRPQSSMASNNTTYIENSTPPSTPRMYLENANGTTSNSNNTNHQYFNVWEYNTNKNLKNDNAYNINGNHSPKTVSPRLLLNKYLNGNSNESLDENSQLHATEYPSYKNRDITQRPNDLQYKRNANENVYQMSNVYKENPSQPSNDELKQTNNVKKERDYSFSNSTCERNTSIGNLNSLEENQFCSFFSHSIAEGNINDNISSDYSIFTKNLNNFGSKEEIPRLYSVGNSITGSEISSLANLGTPDSPPRATSPTSEIKVLLDKIQQLPSQTNEEYNENNTNEEQFFTTDVTKAKRYFCKTRKNSLYMPLNLVPNSKTFHPGKVSPTSNTCFKRQFYRKGWLSRSAPTTPCGTGLVPNILNITQRNATTSSGRASRLSKSSQKSQADDSPLLTEQDLSGDEMEN